MLVDSDGELDKIFDDRLRISRVVLGDRTNKQIQIKNQFEIKGEDLGNNGENNVENLKNEDYDPISKKSSNTILKGFDLNHALNPKIENFHNPSFHPTLGYTQAINNLHFSYSDKKEDTKSKDDTNVKDDTIITDEPKIKDSTNIKEEPKIKDSMNIKEDTKSKDGTILFEHGLQKSSSLQNYLSEIEKEFRRIRESHKKMLMTRNKVLKMVEKELDLAKKEIEKVKNKEIRKLEKKIQEMNKANSTKYNSDLLHNYEILEQKYSEQSKEVESLRSENGSLKKQIENINDKYSTMKSKWKETVLQYKESLDNLYLESLRSFKKKYKEKYKGK